MDSNISGLIKKDFQIKKFSAYGFLKNLTFFEPYLIIFLMGSGINLFQIGVLYAVKEAIIYIFEVPSGVIADVYGRKKELYLCFIFYMISFVLFFMTKDFSMAVFAMIFYGLGDAFRSGTHKAMIYTYLEEKNWADHKAFVYGRTRSFSLLGSAISSVVAILLILNIPSNRYIFLASIIPYFLDLLLIMSYPDSLNGPCVKHEVNFFKVMFIHLKGILSRKDLRLFLVRAGSFGTVFSSVKDYVQPILESLFLVSGIAIIGGMSSDDNLKIVLGITYGVIYMLGSLASRRAYLLKKFMDSHYLLRSFNFLLVVSLVFVTVAIEFNAYPVIILLFIIMNLLQNIRKPIFVDACDDLMEKHERATVLSVESQLKSLMTIVIAPVIGFIAESASVSIAMLSVGMFLLAVNIIVILRSS